MSSKVDTVAVRRPNIDDLVAAAQATGRESTTRRTIRHWVERDLVDGAVSSGRDPRYPLRAIGQVDTLARFPIRTHGIDGVRFALFIETDSGSVKDALRIATARTDALHAAVSAARQQAATDPELLRAEVKRAARLRASNSVLPREVRMSLPEREQALAQLAGLALGVRLDGVPAGLAAIERSLGLRSGRGGLTRETPLALTDKDIAAMKPEVMQKSVLTATPARARIARNLVELLYLWFPALLPSLLTTTTTVEQKFLQVVQSRGNKPTPEAYLATFAGVLATQRPLPEKQLLQLEGTLQPAAVMLEMLTTQPPGDLDRVLSRLRPLQRLKLEATLSLAQPRQEPGPPSPRLR